MVSTEKEVTDSRDGRIKENLESREMHQELCGGYRGQDSGIKRQKGNRKIYMSTFSFLPFYTWLALMIIECLLPTKYIQKYYLCFHCYNVTRATNTCLDCCNSFLSCSYLPPSPSQSLFLTQQPDR